MSHELFQDSPLPSNRPTVVLVHGAFAGSDSWNQVITRLHAAGVRTVAAANPLRSLDGDAESVGSVFDSIDGDVVAVGHSYGGAVITNAARGRNAVKALVFVAAFAPAEGESIGFLSGQEPGSTLGETLAAVPLPDGSTDFSIRHERFHAQFCADVPGERAALDAVTQRPLRDVALTGESGAPAWAEVPSWFVYPEADLNIPLAVHRSMAERAGSRRTVEIAGASHALAVSQPDAVAEIILAAVESIGS